jgi:hypothetical protein
LGPAHHQLKLVANTGRPKPNYEARAEALPAPLITRDRKLATATGHRAEVEVV